MLFSAKTSQPNGEPQLNSSGEPQKQAGRNTLLVSGNIWHPTPAAPPDQGCWGFSKQMFFGDIALPATGGQSWQQGEHLSMVLVVLLPEQLEESGALI